MAGKLYVSANELRSLLLINAGLLTEREECVCTDIRIAHCIIIIIIAYN